MCLIIIEDPAGIAALPASTVLLETSLQPVPPRKPNKSVW